ncbi:hypothetical protein M2302_001672 [Micromonospora sp. A200]|uniref:DUF3592 domain-containing protein n=1 Tax=Micromonospora sp. A200 TaxID=2940568 RepID=UPI002473F5AB|nr:DUF3592 domain-containing protein [Micromonospora sp. A200]MDH6461502.1 hypothetical protein [Micromonospora sp. A200]
MASRNERRRRRSQPSAVASAAPVDPVQREPRSRWRPGYWLRHPAFAAVLVVSLSALTFVACGVGSLLEARDLRERGESAVAVVVEARELRRGSLLKVGFTTTQGERVVAHVAGPPEDLPTPGERLTVVYDPEDRDYVYLRSDKPYEKGGWLILGGRLFLAIGLLATAIYLAYLRWTWHRWRDQAERWRHRRPVPRLGKRQEPWRTEQRDDPLP